MRQVDGLSREKEKWVITKLCKAPQQVSYIQVREKSFNIRIHKYFISYEYDFHGRLSPDKHMPISYLDLGHSLATSSVSGISLYLPFLGGVPD